MPLKRALRGADEGSVTPQIAVVAFAVSAGMLALWLDARFPRLGPAEMRGVILHAICAYGLFLGQDVLFGALRGDEAWRRFAALFLVDLALLVYMFIVCVWVMKVLRGALSAAR
jgi:hypothetical protein